ncbi:hypothetical protein ACHAWF_010337 [Thalassiosira exigua]
MRVEGTTTSPEDPFVDPLAEAVARELLAAGGIAERTRTSDYDRDPDARGGPRRRTQQHVTSQHHSGLPPVVITVNGKVVKCDEENLTENELIHCNAALEWDRNDGQGGNTWEVIWGSDGLGGSEGPGGPPGGGAAPIGGGGGGTAATTTAETTAGKVVGIGGLSYDPLDLDDPNHPTNPAGPNYDPTYDGPGSQQGQYVDHHANPQNQNQGDDDEGGGGVVDLLASSAVPSASARPTDSPSMAKPTSSPSFHPTVKRDPWVLRGTVYYDRNANGERDSNVDSFSYGKDVEYSYGLGGVVVQLMECDPATNEGLGRARVEDKYEDGENSFASTVSSGYDVLMHPKLVGREERGGMYNLIDIKVNRAYYIHLRCPEGYLFAGGVCNDDEPGWECDYAPYDAGKFAQGGRVRRRDEEKRRRRLLEGNREGGRWGRRYEGSSSVGDAQGARDEANGGILRGLLRRFLQNASPAQYLPSRGEAPREEDLEAAAAIVVRKEATRKELELGIREGRSERCVTVDRHGMPDGHLDVGVMRLGDVSFDEVAVELSLDLVDVDVGDGGTGGGRDGDRRTLLRRLGRRKATTLLEDRYFLKREDKEAIGSVTSEILAINLDASLKKDGVVLDSVAHVDVLYFAPPPEEVETEATANSTEAEGDGAVHAKGGTADADDAGDADASPDRGGMPARGRGGGKLSVSLLVRGHYNRNLNVDFDYLVQDSINRDTRVIRRQLTYYNQNCRDQTSKVVDLGFTLEDFFEIHTNRGVQRPSSRLSRQRQMELDAAAAAMGEDDDGRTFSSACDEDKVLPDYFEKALGGTEPRADAVGTTYTVDEGGPSPAAIVGAIVAFGVLAVAIGYVLFRRGLKRRRDELREEVKVTHILAGMDDDLDHLPGGSEKKDGEATAGAKERFGGVGGGSLSARVIPVDAGRGGRGGLVGRMRREVKNMAAALSSERTRQSERFFVGNRNGAEGSDLAGDAELHETLPSDKDEADSSDAFGVEGLGAGTGGAADGVLLPMDGHVDASATSDPDLLGHILTNDEEGPEPNGDKAGKPDVKPLDKSLVSLDKSLASCTSRDAAPKIVQVDFEEDEESLEIVSESDEDDESSDSSSSSEDLEMSARAMARRDREKKERKAAEAKKRSSKSKRGSHHDSVASLRSKRSGHHDSATSLRSKRGGHDDSYASLRSKRGHDDSATPLRSKRGHRRRSEGESKEGSKSRGKKGEQGGGGGHKKRASVDSAGHSGHRRRGMVRRPSQDDLVVGRYRRHHTSGGEGALRRSKCDMDIGDVRRLSLDLDLV